ncbi:MULTISPECIES: oxygenase MpaB family protein [unclassified Sphingomonas]|uniref:oxygenase MpaB family protein n=1 Tax=unclassified Sphingomonas TaxID=196159 RepID=UPI0006FD94CE|nr:histidine kinase [Sphingomonas sp. Leaf9]KQM45742.1 histidine kinase [Sphingomonas sp. Leaf11]
MNPLRQTIARQVRGLTGAGDGAIDLRRPPGDDGLFGPGSVSWRVHGDFSSMMIGGTTALLMQMLHPAALAGVWDHSNFRRDMLGRLKRTAQFIAGTTYGGTAEAGRLIDHVRHIHDRVHGVLPDGTPYDANDPHLLTWVHVAETDSFLRAYLRYRDPHLSRADQDRYFAENVVVAERLGARDVSDSRAAVDAWLLKVRGELCCDHRTRTVRDALLQQPLPNPFLKGFGALNTAAAIDLLPPWARAMLELRSTAPLGVRAGAQGMARMLRWALNGSASEKTARAQR